jgi:D-amino-acid oxidase
MMLPQETFPSLGAVAKDVTPEQNQERFVVFGTSHSHLLTIYSAHINASRHSDSSIEAQVESAQRASELRSLRATEHNILSGELCKEVDDGTTLNYRRFTAHLQAGVPLMPGGTSIFNVSQPISPSKHTLLPQQTFFILGAGIAALTIAGNLVSAPCGPGHLKPKVIIFASDLPSAYSVEQKSDDVVLPPTYASPWAGAQWRSHAQPTTPAGVRDCGWDLSTYKTWQNMSEECRHFLGIGTVKGRLVWDIIDDEIAAPESGMMGDKLWWKNVVEDFRELGTHERPAGTVFGVEWTTYCVNVPKHLAVLHDLLVKEGVTIYQGSLPNGRDFESVLTQQVNLIGEHVDFIINATGIRAGELCSDSEVYPTKGQTILVKGEAAMARTRKGDGYIAYTIPRPGSGTTILGGVNRPNDWTETVDEELHQSILERAKELAPELLNEHGEFDVIRKNVGFRPSRRGGARVEVEQVGKWKVVHAYGFGGAGYQNSAGIANEVMDLLYGKSR